MMLVGSKGFFCGQVTQVMYQTDYLVLHSEAEKTRLRDMTEAHLKQSKYTRLSQIKKVTHPSFSPWTR